MVRRYSTPKEDAVVSLYACFVPNRLLKSYLCREYSTKLSGIVFGYEKKCFVLGLEALNKFDFLPDVETPAPSRLGRDAQQVGDISRKKLKCLPLPNRS